MLYVADMKTIAFALCAFFLAPLPALAGGAQPSHAIISVHGTGIVSQMPDVADITVTISTVGNKATDVTSRNNAAYERIAAALKGLGIGANDLRTAGYNLSYNPPPNPLPKTVNPYVHYGYSLYRSFTIHVEKLDLVGKAIDASIGNGATGINGVNFGIADQHNARQHALAKAAADARAQAQAVAAAEHLRLGRIISIEIDGATPRYFPQQGLAVKMMMAAPTPSPTEIAPSAVAVQAGVTVTYALLP
ncbi:MAG: SIMPL domain-containing protein [Candidatus Eremiobacteraeota bacterium]|uniref:26 kDa periplasmic immunogenic protein n=1 Tax=mine drainage metagenome TaxID=410659 RepID=E6PIJ0_9ZZZZ|nr:SIMPL domain-containing protein [Candidatus Eremiobacteraeota bacterium]